MVSLALRQQSRPRCLLVAAIVATCSGVRVDDVEIGEADAQAGEKTRYASSPELDVAARLEELEEQEQARFTEDLQRVDGSQEAEEIQQPLEEHSLLNEDSSPKSAQLMYGERRVSSEPNRDGTSHAVEPRRDGTRHKIKHGASKAAKTEEKKKHKSRHTARAGEQAPRATEWNPRKHALASYNGEKHEAYFGSGAFHDGYCWSDEDGETLGCNEGCRCGVLSQCYPHSVWETKPGKDPEPVNVGVCSLSLPVLFVISAVIIISLVLSFAYTLTWVKKCMMPPRSVPLSN